MGLLKKILIALLVLIAIPLVIAAFTKKEFDVVRTITINKPQQEVFDYIRLLKNQDNFSVWAAMDPNMKKTYSGTDGTVGFVAGWESEDPNVGHGEQEIKAIKEGERIDYELRFLKPWESTSPAYLALAGQGRQTEVTWGFHGKMPFPMNLMLVFTSMEDDLAGQLDQGLKNLKAQLE